MFLCEFKRCKFKSKKKMNIQKKKEFTRVSFKWAYVQLRVMNVFNQRTFSIKVLETPWDNKT